MQVPALFHGNINRSFYWAAVTLAALAFALTVIISRAKFGYYLMAIREDEDTALSVGIDAARNKLAALLISAALTAVAGALYASIFLFIVPDQVLALDVSNEIAIVAMLGGAGTVLGPIVGSVVLETASEIFKNTFKEAHLLIFGVLLVVVVLFLPGGIMGHDQPDRCAWLANDDIAGRDGRRARSMALLEVDHVSKRFGGLRAVSDVAFSIEERTITFIVGPNGAGKTTLFNLITGVVHPDEGRIRFDGADITQYQPEPRGAARHRPHVSDRQAARAA